MTLVLGTALLAQAVAAEVVSPAPVTVTVTARHETQPVDTANADAADDPAIWRDARHPERSLIVATDKKRGLYVYGLDGKSRYFTPAGRVNNVDLLDRGRDGVIVVASDRNDEAHAKLLVYRLDTASAALVPLGAVSGGDGEAYGVCLTARKGGFDAFSVTKDGAIHQVRVALHGAAVSGAVVRTMRLATQTEGCVVDPRTRTLYVGEEDRGIWAFDVADGSVSEPRLVAPVDGVQLVADVEGLALMAKGGRDGWLVASSQGDNAYAVFRLRDGKPVGRFRVTQGRFGATEETDGIALAAGRFGREYPAGLFVAQDGHNAPAAQNFKLMSWRDVLRALRKAR